MGSVGNIFVNAMTGDKWVDPYMYPGRCVDYCNGKGASSASQKSKYKTDHFTRFQLGRSGSWQVVPIL